MTYLDNNIVNVALPTIQHRLHVSMAGLEWVVSGYILVFAGLLLTGGRLADAFGRRRLFLTGRSGSICGGWYPSDFVSPISCTCTTYSNSYSV